MVREWRTGHHTIRKRMCWSMMTSSLEARWMWLNPQRFLGLHWKSIGSMQNIDDKNWGWHMTVWSISFFSNSCSSFQFLVSFLSLLISFVRNCHLMFLFSPCLSFCHIHHVLLLWHRIHLAHAKVSNAVKSALSFAVKCKSWSQNVCVKTSSQLFQVSQLGLSSLISGMQQRRLEHCWEIPWFHQKEFHLRFFDFLVSSTQPLCVFVSKADMPLFSHQLKQTCQTHRCHQKRDRFVCSACIFVLLVFVFSQSLFWWDNDFVLVWHSVERMLGGLVRIFLLHCAKSYRPFELFANENCKL